MCVFASLCKRIADGFAIAFTKIDCDGDAFVLSGFNDFEVRRNAIGHCVFFLFHFLEYWHKGNVNEQKPCSYYNWHNGDIDECRVASCNRDNTNL